MNHSTHLIVAFLPKQKSAFPEKKMSKYFTKKEVAVHHKTDDAWLIVSGKIYDLSSVIRKYGPDAAESKPLVMFAGKDISHWFDKDADNVICNFSWTRK
jgi:cytochrome b involved in lipid metabolism